MNKYITSAFCALMMLTFAPRASSAASYPIDAHIYTHNETDAFVWVSVDTTARGGWCVPARGRVQHSPQAIPAEVRAEFFKAACKRGARLYEHVLPFPQAGGLAVYRAASDAGGYHFTGPFSK